MKISIYLSMSILTKIQDKKNVCKYAGIVGILFVSVFPFLGAVLHFSYNGALKPGILTNYLIFVFIGYYLNQSEWSRKKRFLIYALGIIGWLTHFLGTVYFSLGQEKMNTVFKGYYNLPCLLHSIALFVLFKNINWDFLQKNKKVEKAIIKDSC